jgi:putative ABC transport system substrate-binding protein
MPAVSWPNGFRRGSPCVRRREFITLLGGAAAWPLAARAQQPGKRPIVGFLGDSTPVGESERAAAFARRLHDLGWIEGRTIAIEYRWADGRSERLAEIAAEFAQLKVDIIVTAGTPAVMAAKQAAPVVPIVFAAAGDPVGAGLVTTLARPGGNVTGLSVLSVDLAGKRLDLLREAISNLGRLAIMGNVGNPIVVLELGELQAAARMLGLQVDTLEIRRSQDIAPALEAVKGRADALLVCQDLLTRGSNRLRINTLALAARLPVMHASRELIEAAGLMSYGANFVDLYRRAGDYVDKILRGAKPADLPVEQPTKFDLVINLITARALGLTISPTLLAAADEVIE